jgi:hypothetical protein
MSGRLLTHRALNPDRVIVALVANTLASKRSGADWDLDLMPLGARIASVLPLQTHAYDVAFDRGLQWVCRLMENGSIRCGSFGISPGPAQSATKSQRTNEPFVRFPSVSEFGFDGTYFVGRLEVSPPAIPGLVADEGWYVLKR